MIHYMNANNVCFTRDTLYDERYPRYNVIITIWYFEMVFVFIFIFDVNLLEENQYLLIVSGNIFISPRTNKYWMEYNVFNYFTGRSRSVCYIIMRSFSILWSTACKHI